MKTDEMRFQKLIENAPEAVSLLGADGKLMYASLSAHRMFGYAADELIGADPGQLTHPDDVQGVVAILVDLMQHPGKVVTTQYRFRHKDGRWRWIESVISNLLAEPGVNAIVFNFRDITDRIEAEKALRESEERFRLAFRTSPDAININRLSDGLYVDINEGFTQLTGYTRDDVIGKTSTEINIWYDRTDRDHLVAAIRTHGQTNNFESKFRLKDGSVVRALMSAKIILLDGVPHVLSVTRDVEKRKQIEDALATSEQRYRMLIEQASDGIFLADEQGNFVDVNPSGCAMFGYSREEILGIGMIDLLFLEDQPKFPQILDRLHADQEYLAQYRLRRKDGSPIHVEINGKILPDGHMQGMVRDISERVKAEAALRDSEELFRMAFRTSPDSIHINRMADGLIVDVNEGFTKITGYTRAEAIGRTSNDLGIWQDTADRMRFVAELQANGEVHNFEAKVHMKNGSIVRSLISAKIIMLNGVPHILSISRDIEQLKQMEDALSESNRRLEFTLDELRQTQSQLVQQESLAAVGQLAAGIAHDFNNILAVITLQTQIALTMPTLPAPLRSRLETITQQAKLAAELAQQMLDFGRRSVLQVRPLNLVALLADQVHLLRYTLPAGIKVHLSHAAEDYVINADPTRLQQMITNLALNARDAMPNGGVLCFHLDHYANPLEENRAWLRLTVSDSGIGIDDAILPHIFEPFFTTKPPGRGTGLGLAQVYGIVKQHNGHIEVESQPGQGTVFVVTLPLHVPSLPVDPPQKRPADYVNEASDTVLVIEDDPTLRQALVDMLELLNYTPLFAADSKEALAQFQAHGDEISAVLYDLGIPKADAQMLWQEMTQPGFTQPLVILCSDSQQTKLWTQNGVAIAGWLQKPVDPEKLAEVIADAVKIRHVPA